MIKDLIKKNRSYRKFDSEFHISRNQLEDLIDLARFSASASNRQLLRFYLVNEKNDNDKVFSCLKWAGYLTDWQGPALQQRPSAYIVILKPNQSHAYIGHDTGIAAQSILLGAVEMGLGGCMFGSVDRDKLTKYLDISQEYEIEIVIALGKPIENVQIDDAENDNIRYWRDKNNTHHVPKITRDKLIIND